MTASDVTRIAESTLVAFLDYQGYGWEEQEAKAAAIRDVIAAEEHRETETESNGVCGFCHGQSVTDAASFVDGRPRDPAPCPRCGETAAAPLDRDDGKPITEEQLLNGYGAEIDTRVRNGRLPQALRRDLGMSEP